MGLWSRVLLEVVCYDLISPYRLAIKFNKTELNTIVRFGTGITLTKISNYGANNLDYYVTGTFLDSQALGFYQRSFQLITAIFVEYCRNPDISTLSGFL